MKKRIRVKRKMLVYKTRGEQKKLSKHNILFISFFIILLFIIISFKIINDYVSPILMNYAELEVKKLSSTIMNKAVSEHIINGINLDELFIVTKDNTGIIKTVDFNPIIVNRLLNTTTNSILTNIKYVEQGKIELLSLPNDTLINYDRKSLEKGIIYEIPIGVVFGNAVLNNLGPKIPVKLNLVGDVVSKVKTKTTNYGINNALVEVSVSLQITQRVVLPLLTKEISISLDVPISIKLIQGTVPNYYSNGLKQNSPSLAIPIE